MNRSLLLSEITDRHRHRVGGKAFALSRLHQHGIPVPSSLCILTSAYREYVSGNGLRERIMLDLKRKEFDDMRWEEIWDLALRIRNMFLTTDIPPGLGEELSDAISEVFQSEPVVVRSSAPGEDSAKSSFAGLHESFVNIKGIDSIIEHIRLVWASLWSNRALLYRKELALNIDRSEMAVLIQEIVSGEKSGVGFSQNPDNNSVAVIEAVHGLNQGLVDGTVEPDRWIINRSNGQLIDFHASERKFIVASDTAGVTLQSLKPEIAQLKPLKDTEVKMVFQVMMELEHLFGVPQDVEWTFKGDMLVVLQSRPITTIRNKDENDERNWYFSLQRSLHNLENLKEKITVELLPAMDDEADNLAAENLDTLSNTKLAYEITRREETYSKWKKVYWDNFIPFAHAIRLFGQFYNDHVKPDDPFEFTGLLGKTSMISLKRNKQLMDIAREIKQDQENLEKIVAGDFSNIPDTVQQKLDEYLNEYGLLNTKGANDPEAHHHLLKLLTEMSEKQASDLDSLEQDVESQNMKFFSCVPQEKKEYAKNLLKLARISYKLRDDDNIHLGKIEQELNRAIQEGKNRIYDLPKGQKENINSQDLVRYLLKEITEIPVREEKEQLTKVKKKLPFQIRQIQGQPASPGIAFGKARVMNTNTDIFEFKANEILVCDAIDPNMTFVVPLAAGIVERRGGMLIHGAIIAREYNIPCVTGIPDATNFISSGDYITVDGHLGIVTVNKHH